jgi:hypothetical protein
MWQASQVIFIFFIKLPKMSGQSQDPTNTDYRLGTGTSTGGIGHKLGTSELNTGGHSTDGLGTNRLGMDKLGMGELGTGGLGTGGLYPNVTGTH